MRDFGDKRSTTWNQDPKAANVGLAPSKRTLVEMLPQPVSAPEMPTLASSPVQRKAESSAIVPATPSGPRLTAPSRGGIAPARSGSSPARRTA